MKQVKHSNQGELSLAQVDHSNPGELSLAQPLMFFVPVLLFVATLAFAFGGVSETLTHWASEFGSGFIGGGLLLAMLVDLNSKGAEIK